MIPCIFEDSPAQTTLYIADRAVTMTADAKKKDKLDVCTLKFSVICTLLKLGIVFVTSVIYHWNQRVSESQDQNNTWPTQEWSSVRTLRLSVQMALSQLGTTFTTFLFHRWNQRICLSQNNVCWRMWVGSGLTPWFHRVPTVMTRGACQILGRVAGQFSHFSQVERHMAYTLFNESLFIKNDFKPKKAKGVEGKVMTPISNLTLFKALSTAKNQFFLLFLRGLEWIHTASPGKQCTTFWTYLSFNLA
ncbi:hypothetical protein PROFUN_01134 [Planoprotostelium fungivorum]|uniref:Uncharacterized protein n=1 Tax=Planoprotostelium fungivorum TaxID=1890364 RepID=A0A2P6NCE2_9EUKA|nr:hypothetical protein PROFUN_01134 [Planoprotostelium fungivorum]